MNEVWTLTALELRSLCGLNCYRHTKDKKAKNQYRLLFGVWILVIAMAVFYVAGLVCGLWALGLMDVVPAYLATVASLLIFFFGLFGNGAAIFSKQGYDILTAMPIKTVSIPLSRFLRLYVEDLALTLVVMVPGLVTYGILAQPQIGFYLMAVPGVLLIPAIPLVAGVLFGTLVMALSAGMKHKSLIQSLLTVGFVVVVLLASFGSGYVAEDMTPEMLAEFAGNIADMIRSLYIPAAWLGNAMQQGSVLDFALFAGVSVGVVALVMWLISRNFHRIMGKLLSFSARHRYQLGDLESRSLLKALYLRELKRYFSSSIYVSNTIVGPIMGTILAGAVCFAGMDAIASAIPMDISGLVPYGIAGVFCMMTTTSTAISMEGKWFWIIKSLPVPTKTLLDSKILLNLSLMLPFYVLTEIFLVIGLQPGFLELLWLLLIPAEVMLLSVVAGITVNLKLHRFDWEKEGQIVKQSASAALGGFAGFFLAVILGTCRLLVPPQLGNLASGIICILLPALTWLLYTHNNKAKLEVL